MTLFGAFLLVLLVSGIFVMMAGYARGERPVMIIGACLISPVVLLMIVLGANALFGGV